MKKRTRKIGELPLNMTPMIDCVMLLLVFFMVASKFKSAEADILSLAYARNAERVENEQPGGERIGRFVINVRFEQKGSKNVIFTVRGIVFDPQSPPSLDKLGDSLQTFRRQEPKGEIMVRVDRNVEYRYVKKLQEMMREKLGVMRGQELKITYSVDPNPPEQVQG